VLLVEKIIGASFCSYCFGDSYGLSALLFDFESADRNIGGWHHMV